MKRQLTHRAQQTHDSYHVRKLGVHANGAHAYVELQQDQDRPEQVSLDISGGCLDYAGVGPIGQVSWEVRGPEALRAVAEALLVLADRAEELGMLTALRTHRRASSTAITAA